MHYPIIYLHIPKTAGTSFRVSAENYFGIENTLSDYGENSDATSNDILTHFYTNEDHDTLRNSSISKKFLGGHFSLPRYRDIFPDSPIITFFRDPVDRVVSEYVHFANHHGFTGTLEEFYRTNKFRNRQQRCLSGAMPTDLDLYGITEQYERSVEIFNQRFNTRLDVAVLNKGNYQSDNLPGPTPEQIEEIQELNQGDIAIYANAVKNFEQQATDQSPTTLSHL